ncbi:MAG: CoA activase [Phycisphaerae bacterium]|nr:CoA activase [Phycisphaerae bacterium]
MVQRSSAGSETTANATPEPVAQGAAGMVHIGFDIGSVAAKLVVLDGAGKVLEEQYQRHLGQPVKFALSLLDDVLTRHSASQIGTLAGTGTAGRFVCKLMDTKFINELSCQAAAIRRLVPEARTVVEMGGQDSKLIFLSGDAGDLSGIEDFAMNTACAAGTGSFLDQQASRIGLDVSELGQLALKCEVPPRVAGRCSVFAKSDMIHLQQQATPVHDIVAGLCFGLARNLKSNLGRGKDLTKPVVFTGGVAWNAGVVRAMREVLEADGPGQFVVPEQHALTGAIGAGLLAMRDWDGKSCVEVNLHPLREYLSSQKTIGHRLAKLTRPERGYPRMETQADEVFSALKPGQKVPAFLGIDVGSISTNVVVIDEQQRVLAKAYLMTASKPLEAVRQGLAMVGEVVADKVEIRGVATTGSGRYLTGDFVGADTVVNEITAQATAAAVIDPQVDTIFEIGGQDSKYISLENGVVVDFEMNHACAAGTGSFLEEQAERLGIDIKTQFSNLALSAENPIRLGERCTVFMESDLLNYQQQGARTDDLVGGLCYSIVANYLNRVVGRRKIGNRIFFQGGTAFNKGVVAAFESVTGKPVTVPPHHEVTGAIGVAILAKRYVETKGITTSTFRGFDISQRKYEIRSFECTHCANNCEIKEVTIEGSDAPLYYGSRCDRYNVKKDQEQTTATIPDLFRERQAMLEKFARVRRKPSGGRKTVGIPLMLGNFQLLPFWGTFFDELGYEPIVSPPSTKKLIRRGVEAVVSQPCFPVKVAHGHVIDLLDRKLDYLWLPSVVSLERDEPDINNQLCPYVQTIPYQIQVAIDLQRYGTKMLAPYVRFQDGWKELVRCMQVLCDELGVSKAQIASALRAAQAAQRAFEAACRQRGQEVLGQVKPDERAMVLVSRPYNGCDPGVSLDIPGKLRKLGMLTIPLDFLDFSTVSANARYQAKDGMYWKYGQRIIKGAKIVRNDPRLFAVYLTNFSCGPDSFIGTFFKDLMGQKPYLMLEIDEHSADAGVVTRLEAYLESLRNAKNVQPAPIREEELQIARVDCSRRKVYIPWMGDHAYALAAAFRACGQPSEVLPLADQETLEIGRRFTTGKECLPCIVTTGDMVKKAWSTGFDAEHSAFFMPGGSGPCRFGQYNCLQRLVLNEIGMAGVPVVSPSQDKSFYEDFRQFRQDPTRLAWNGIVAVDVLLKALLALRPYEIRSGETVETYRRWVDEVSRAIEANASERELGAMMRSAARAFKQIKVDRTVRKPHIGIVGEIYVRSHVFSNDYLVDRLESLGAQVSLASFAEWMYYTNFTRKRTARREAEWKSLMINWVKDRLQKKIERNLAEPFEEVIPHAVEPAVEEIIEFGSAYIHDSFEGEAGLSVGKMIEYHRHGVDAIVNVGPFTCMPSTIVSAVMKKLAQDLDNMPMITIMYDGQGDPTMDTRLEAFIDQARSFQAKRTRHTGSPVTAGK